MHRSGSDRCCGEGEGRAEKEGDWLCLRLAGSDTRGASRAPGIRPAGLASTVKSRRACPHEPVPSPPPVSGGLGFGNSATIRGVMFP